jgi:energy-coupling factor transport system permease protein
MNAKPKILYQPKSSWLHRLHPLVKLCWLLTLSIALFVIQSPAWVLTVLFLAALAFPSARLSLRRDVRGARFLAVMGILLFSLQAVFNRTGTTLLHLPLGLLSLSLTSGGLIVGIYVGGRFLALIFMSYLFVLTTEPSALAYALMQIGLPYRYGFVLITALRLAPIFEIESNVVYQAQLTRGVRYDIRRPCPWRDGVSASILQEPIAKPPSWPRATSRR